MSLDNKDRFSQLIKEQLEGFEDEPNPNSWNNISSTLKANNLQNVPKVNPWIGRIKIFALATSVMVAAYWIFRFTQGNQAAVNSEQSTPKAPMSADMEVSNENKKEIIPIENSSPLQQESKGTISETKENKVEDKKEIVVTKKKLEVEETLKKEEKVEIKTEEKALLEPKHEALNQPKTAVVDSAKSHQAPQSLYKKHLKDTTLKYRELFKKK